jgi:V/A-type H+-transporting ATPase subunit K
MQTVLGMSGFQWAELGAALAFIFGAIGSSVGITYVANVSSGILAEDPDKFGRLLLLIAMPGSQGIYGFITAFLIWVFFLSNPKSVANPQIGVQVFLASLPVAVACLISAIYQGRTGAGAAGIVAKKEEAAGRAVVLPGLVETYAVLSLIISILFLIAIRG